MNEPSRFDLERALQRWRNEVQQAGTVTDEQRVELETHLLESLTGLRSLGLSEEEAFLLACRRLGNTGQLSDQFAITNSWAPPFTRGWKIFGWTCFAVACLFFFLGCARLSYPGEQFHSRISVGSAIASALESGLRTNMRVVFVLAVVGAASLLVIFFRFGGVRWIRMLIMAACLASVLALFLQDVQHDFWAGLLGYMVSLPALTLRVVAGRVSGEFYQDGLVIGLAYGWWLGLWLVFALRELLGWSAKVIARAVRDRKCLANG